jgi:hypothetical protein
MDDSLSHSESGAGPSPTPRMLLSAVFLALLIVRVLGLVSVYFFEEDEASIAMGVASIMAETPGGLYRYTVQFGYYRLVELVLWLIGGRIDLIPAVMKGLAALAGAAIPTVGFFAFRRRWSVRERWLVVGALAINPIIWRSSQYGNTALVATALGTSGIVLLTNDATSWRRLVAYVLVAAAVFVRADSVLLLPVVAVLRYLADRQWRAAVADLLLLVGAIAAVYALTAVVDTRFDSASGSVAEHMGIARPSMFWEYFLWAMGPAALFFGVWALRGMSLTRGGDLLVLLVWALPTIAFYFRATTTSRYFLNAAVPLSLLAAVGMADLAHHLTRWLRTRTAALVVGAVATAHLFVALGHVPADRPIEFLYGGTFQTDDGPMQTGALLVRTFLAPGSLARNLPRPTFGRTSYPFWEGPVFNKAIELLRQPAAGNPTTSFILWGGYGHVFHYHLHTAGASYVQGPPPGSLLWDGQQWIQVGENRLMTIGGKTKDYRELARLDVKEGDRVWSLKTTYPDIDDLEKIPPGLRLEPVETFDPAVRTFTVVRR